MFVRCSAKQVAEAVLIWSSHNGRNPILCIEFEDIENLKCLDLFFSTLAVFIDAFSSEMEPSSIECMELSLSKKSLVDYLKPRALLLAGENGYFDFMLICTYFSRIVNFRAIRDDCFHMARVACKLLTRILEVRFKEIFETDSGWVNLISYCRSIHAAVYPSQKNRPAGYDSKRKMGAYEEEVAVNIDGIARAKRAKVIGEIGEKEISELKVREHGNERHSDLFAEMLGLMPRKKESDNSSGLEDDAIGSESVTDDATYWKYSNLNTSTICERITRSKKHLKDVCDLLRNLQQNADAKCISLNEYDVSVSDDEYIEQLEEDEGYNEQLKKEEKDKYIEQLEEDEEYNEQPEDEEYNEQPEDEEYIEQPEKEGNDALSFIEQAKCFSDTLKELIANEICEEENETLGTTSGQDQSHPEDITDHPLLEYFLKGFFKEDPKCKLCEGKMQAFMENWFDSFLEKYSNSSIVTDLIV